MEARNITKLIKKYGDKLLFALALTVLAAALLRYGINKAGAPSITPPIVFTQWLEEYLEKDTLQGLIREFEDAHEGLKIVLNYKSYEDLHNDESPQGDLIALDPLWVPGLANRRIIEEQQIPVLTFANILYYNVEILRDAGFSKPPKTRAEFLSCAKALAIKDKNRWALGLGGYSSRGLYDDILPWIWAAGVQLIGEGKPSLSSRPIIDSFSFLAGLKAEGLIDPDAFFKNNKEKLDDFVSGKAAFIVAPACEIEFIRERMGDEAFSVTSIPTPDNFTGKTYFGFAGWNLGINSSSGHKEKARLFAEFLASRLPEKTRAAQENSAGDPFYSKVWDIAIAGEAAQDFTGLSWEDLEAVFSEELSALFTGQPPAETAAAIQKRWDAAIGIH